MGLHVDLLPNLIIFHFSIIKWGVLEIGWTGGIGQWVLRRGDRWDLME